MYFCKRYWLMIVTNLLFQMRRPQKLVIESGGLCGVRLYTSSLRVFCYLSNILSSLFLVLLCSCSDGYLAEKIEGEWKASYVIANEDESKEEIIELSRFKKNDDFSGTLVESRQFHVSNITANEITASFDGKSCIEGSWEFIGGDLYCKYNLSTLVVSVNRETASFKYENTGIELLQFQNMIETFKDPEDEYVEALRKDMYSCLFESYQEINQEKLPYRDVEIDDDVMKLTYSDSQILIYKRMR